MKGTSRRAFSSTSSGSKKASAEFWSVPSDCHASGSSQAQRGLVCVSPSRIPDQGDPPDCPEALPIVQGRTLLERMKRCQDHMRWNMVTIRRPTVGRVRALLNKRHRFLRLFRSSQQDPDLLALFPRLCAGSGGVRLSKRERHFEKLPTRNPRSNRPASQQRSVSPEAGSSGRKDAEPVETTAELLCKQRVGG